jgi:hypothetical protein
VVSNSSSQTTSARPEVGKRSHFTKEVQGFRPNGGGFRRTPGTQPVTVASQCGACPVKCSVFQQNIFTVDSAPLRIPSAAYHQSAFLKPSSWHNASRSHGKRRSASYLNIGDTGIQRYGRHGTRARRAPIFLMLEPALRCQDCRRKSHSPPRLRLVRGVYWSQEQRLYVVFTRVGGVLRSKW